MQRTDIYCKYTKAGLRDRAQTTADIVGVTLTPRRTEISVYQR